MDHSCKNRFIFVLAAIMALEWGATALAGDLIVPRSSYLTIDAVAWADLSDLTTRIEDAPLDCEKGAIDPLMVSADAMSFAGDAWVHSSGQGMATWIDATQGEVIFCNIGWETRSAGNSAAELGPIWHYEFTATDSGTFTLAFDTQFYGSSSFGVADYTLVGPDENPYRILPYDSGTITVPFRAGDNAIEIRTGPNIFGTLGTQDTYMTGVFDWSFGSP